MNESFIIFQEKDFALSGVSLSELLKEALAQNYSFRFRVKGTSMSPFIKNNDIVSVQRPRGENLWVGTVISFIQPRSGKFCIHRIIAKNRDGFITKGDSTEEIDGLVTKADILGLISSVERNGGFFNVGLGRLGFFIALASRSGLLEKIRRTWQCFPFGFRLFISRRIEFLIQTHLVLRHSPAQKSALYANLLSAFVLVKVVN